MRNTDIYQTLEDRSNDIEVENHGPFFCSEREPDGSLKKGVKEPWLGAGYYFWDSRQEDAKWWGDVVYKTNGYIVCKTTYDQHSPLLYDLVGIINHFDEFVECAKLIKERRCVKTIKFPVVLSYLKKLESFKYKAIRVWPSPHRYNNSCVEFPNNKVVLEKTEKIQICFFDKTLLTEPFKVVYRSVFTENQTI